MSASAVLAAWLLPAAQFTLDRANRAASALERVANRLAKASAVPTGAFVVPAPFGCDCARDARNVLGEPPYIVFGVSIEDGRIFDYRVCRVADYVPGDQWPKTYRWLCARGLKPASAAEARAAVPAARQQDDSGGKTVAG